MCSWTRPVAVGNFIALSLDTMSVGFASAASQRRKTQEGCLNLTGSGEYAERSKSILNPMPERLCTERSRATRRMMKLPRIGSESGAFSTRLLNRGYEAADSRRTRVQGAKSTAADVAAADVDVDTLSRQGLEHVSQQSLVVLQVAIDHSRLVGRDGQNAFDTCR